MERKRTELKRIYTEHAELLLSLDVSGAIDRPVFGTGALDAELLLVGEAPGAKETEQGKPFVGQAGKQLDEFLAGIQLDRDSLYVTNAVKYRPIKAGTKANRTPTKKEIDFGRQLLREEIKIISPKIIVTLGNTPLFSLTEDSSIRIGDCHGQLKKWENGKDLGDFQIFSLYHPASLIYNSSLRTVYSDDIRILAEIIAKEHPKN